MFCVASVDSSNWGEWAAAWGPAVPMFGLLMYYLHQHVFVIMPKFLTSLQKTVKREAKEAKRRHKEAMMELHEMCDRIQKIPLCRGATKKDQPPKP